MKIEKKYQESGYVLAKVADIGLDPDGTLTIRINEGLIDNVVIKGNNKTKEKYIKRFIPNLVSGEPYNEILLVQDFRALHGTGLFEDINRTVVPSKLTPGRYDLVVDVVEKRSSSFGFGGGVNTLNGVFANFGFNNSNLFGEGKQFSFNTQLGTGILANALVDQRFLSERKTIRVAPPAGRVSFQLPSAEALFARLPNSFADSHARMCHWLHRARKNQRLALPAHGVCRSFKPEAARGPRRPHPGGERREHSHRHGAGP